MRIALYARVSTGKQAQMDLSIPSQLSRLRAYCKDQHLEIVAEFREEGASARSDQRPRFQEMVGRIERKDLVVDAIMGLSSDRLFRNHEDYAKWKRRLKKFGVRILTISKPLNEVESPHTWFGDSICALADELRSAEIAEHTHRGMRENAERGYACKQNMKSGKSSCAGTRIRAEEIEEVVVGPVLDWAFSEENVQHLVKVLRAALLEREKPARELRNAISEVEKRLGRYFDSFESGALEAVDVADRIKELRLEKSKLEQELVERTTCEELPVHCFQWRSDFAVIAVNKAQCSPQCFRTQIL